MPLTIACSTLCCCRTAYPNFLDCLSKIKEQGFQSYDLAAFENWQNIKPSFLANSSPAAVENLAHSMRKTGMEVVALNSGPSQSISSPEPENVAIYRQEAIALINFAYLTDAKTLTLQPPKRTNNDDQDAASLEQLQHWAKELGPKAKKKGIHLTFETHQGSILEDPKAALRFAESVSNVCGLTYDPSHFIMQGIAIEDTFPLIPHSPHIHVRHSRADQMQAPYPCPESTDFLVSLKAKLQEIDYRGTIAIEYFNHFDPAFQSVQAIKTLFET